MLQKTFQRYELPSNNFIVSDGVGLPTYWVIRDKDSSLGWEHFGKNELDDYIKDAYTVLINRLSIFRDGENNLSPDDEKQLMFMMESLIHAKKVSQEEGTIDDSLEA